MDIRNLKELEKYGQLKLDDLVYFSVGKEIIGYNVRNSFLNLLDHKLIINSYIFKELGLDTISIATECYGYPPNSPVTSFWPESDKDDYSALTRLVKEIYRIIEKKYPEEVYIPIYSRWDIVDF